MRFIGERVRVVVLVLVVCLGSVAHAAHDSGRYEGEPRDGNGYMFAATRQLNHTDAPVLLKATLLPMTLVLDIVFLPIAALADAVS
jgi:uncharacterized protein YceK